MKLGLGLLLISLGATCKLTKQRLLSVAIGFTELTSCEIDLIDDICQRAAKGHIKLIPSIRRYCSVSAPVSDVEQTRQRRVGKNGGTVRGGRFRGVRNDK